MKQLFYFGVLVAAATGIYSPSFAQPVITSSVTLPVTGNIDTIYAASATVPPGGAGAGLTWDLSALTLSNVGTATVVTPSATPYAASFPTANFCIQLPSASGGYNYINISSAGWNAITTSYAGVGTGQDYSPDNRLEVPFPFHYTDSVTDTYQMVGSSSETESIIYDGYGTLITPLHTYTNVVRIKKNYGSDYHYVWYTVSPFYLIMDYSSSGNNYTYLAQIPAATGIAKVSKPDVVQVAPNPISTTGILNIQTTSGLRNASMVITDIAGKIVKQLPVVNTQTRITRDGMANGLYFYAVYNNGNKIATGKILIQ